MVKISQQTRKVTEMLLTLWKKHMRVVSLRRRIVTVFTRQLWEALE